MEKQITKGQTGFHHVRRQPIYLDVTAIADHDSLGGIEHQ